MSLKFFARIERRIRAPKPYQISADIWYLYSKGYITNPRTMEGIEESRKYKWIMYGYKYLMRAMLKNIEGREPLRLAYIPVIVEITDPELVRISMQHPFKLVLVNKETKQIIEIHDPPEWFTRR